MRNGDTEAQDLVFRLLYQRLRQIAVHHMRGERAGHTLQPTALVHEAYLKLIRGEERQWQDRGHFLAVASQVMKCILVDYARKHRAQKRDVGAVCEPLEGQSVSVYGEDVQVLDLDNALAKLAERDPRQARIVEFRYFGGMNEEEISYVLGVHVRTVRRDWKSARAWLYGELRSPSAGSAHATS
jgi:RNA polymerase sigma-70 factor (ECF subfamily)